MEKLKKAIAQYNKTNQEYFEDKNGFNVLLNGDMASNEDITKLEEKLFIQFPNELKSFYAKLGGLSNKNNLESYCIKTDTVSELLKYLTSDYIILKSIGIIHQIEFSWGNDRFEFSKSEGNFTESELNYLNEHYKCIGLYRTDTILESAYYIYYDKAGNFGTVFYHQDDFEAAQEILQNMCNASHATQCLEEILVEAVTKIEEALRSFND
jgi:SMI1 / KNR4 family (SUKH-1)